MTAPASVDRPFDRTDGYTRWRPFLGGAGTKRAGIYYCVRGLSIDDYANLSQRLEMPAGLLPSVFQVLGSVTLDDLVDGVRPDILGELFVLDQVYTQGAVRLASTMLLHHAWLADPATYQGFAERAATDHTEHPRLLDLLIASVSDESPVESAELAVAVIPLLKRSDHPVLDWIFERLDSIRVHVSHERIDQLLTTARFRFANLVFNEGNMQMAYDLFTEAVAQCDPSWPQYGDILNNRGIALSNLVNQDRRLRTSAQSLMHPQRRTRFAPAL